MKAKKRSRNSSSNNQGWSAADHALREEKQSMARSTDTTTASSKLARQAHRTAVLTHDTLEKRTAIKLKLQLTRIQREIQQMKNRLTAWDPQEEAAKERAAREEQECLPPKKKGRKGPETWKLRGAARPAWEVYDFDTRYVDPNLEAHTKAHEKTKRSQNLLATFQGRLACPEAPSIGRDYLGLLMQWGHLSVEAKQYKTARAAWLECMELEGTEHVVTTAREDLMRLYIQLKRYEAALRLGMELKDDSSVWIRYPAAWVAVELEKDSTEIQSLLVDAIRANPFCAYYLAFYDTFSAVMEYTDDVQDADDQPQSTFEEALEYCTSDTCKAWQQNGAAQLLRKLMCTSLQGSGPLDAADVEWEERLSKIELEYDSRTASCTKDEVEQDDEDKAEKAERDDEEVESRDDRHDPIDLKMFSGMFRTAMEMLAASDDWKLGHKNKGQSP